MGAWVDVRDAARQMTDAEREAFVDSYGPNEHSRRTPGQSDIPSESDGAKSAEIDYSEITRGFS